MTKSKNEKLKALYFELVQDIKNNLQEIIRVFNLFSFGCKTASYPSENQNIHYKSHKVVPYILSDTISHSAWNKLIEFDSTKRIFDFIIENNLISPFDKAPLKKIPYEKDILRRPSMTERFIADFIGRMYENSDNSWEFNNQAFNKTYSELEDFLFSDKIEYKILINLYGPIGEIENIKLKNISIKKADYNIAKLFCYHHSESEIERIKHEMQENDYYIEIKREIDKKDWDYRGLTAKDYNIIDKTFNLLILSVPGNIEIGKILTISDNAWPLIKTKRIVYSFRINNYRENNLFRYEINERTKTTIEKNYAKFKSIDYDKLDNKIKASLKRLKKSKSIIEIEDKIIELVLSIEYLINTATYEVTLQLCLKIIKMYDESNQVQSTYELLKNFFKLRGDVVHGNKKVTATPSNVDIIQKVEEITIKILAKYILLNQNYSHKAINEALHKSLYINKPIDEILKAHIT